MNLKVAVVLLFGLLFSVQTRSFANEHPIYLLASVANSGDLAGGIRYTVNSDWIVDGWISSREDSAGNQVTSYWADVYYGNYGIILSGQENTTLLTALAYSVEGQITEEIGIGSSVKVIELGGKHPAYFGGWDVYVIFKL